MGPHLGFSSLLALLNPSFGPSRLMGSIRLAQLTKRNSLVPVISPFRRLFRSFTHPQELLLFLACCQNRLWTCDRLAKRGWPDQSSCHVASVHRKLRDTCCSSATTPRYSGLRWPPRFHAPNLWPL
jgi:hypothetical protein